MLWTVPTKGKKATSVQIEQHMVGIIKSGAVRPREPIPSHRTIAVFNKVNRNTALKAYTKLIATGWLTHSRGGKAVVSDPLPNRPIDMEASEMPNSLPIPLGTLRPAAYKQNMADLFAEIGTFVIDLPDIFRRIPRPKPDRAGHQPQPKRLTLEQAVHEHMPVRGHQVLQANLAVVRGRSECLRCILGTICGEGSLVVNTAPADRMVCVILEQCGLGTLDLEMSTDGFLEQLEQLLAKNPISAVYIRPRGSYPYCQNLDGASSAKLVDLAKRYKFYIIEEDDEHEFWWGRAPLRPMVQLRHDGHVIYCAALSRATPYMQHLRTVIAPTQLIGLLKSRPETLHGYRDPAQEKKIIQLLGTNELATISRKLRLAKLRDMAVLKDILHLQLGTYISYEMPESGTAIWIHFQKKIDLASILHTIHAEGHHLRYTIGHKKAATRIQQLRLDFSSFDRKEAKKIAARLRDLIANGGPY